MPPHRLLLATSLLAILIAACSDPANAPRPVDTAALDDVRVVEAVLDECHRLLRGQTDRIAAWIELPDGSALRAFARLPHDLRVQGPMGQQLLCGDTAARLGGASTALTDAEQAQLRALRTLLDAVVLGPLHRSQGCRRLGPTTFALQAAGGGTETELELRAGTLLPIRIGRGADAVQLDDHLHTAAGTWLAQTASSATLGRCRVRIELGGVTWAKDFFTLPGEAKPPTTRPMTAPGVVVESRSPTPILVDAQAVRWVVLADPGGWPERSTAYTPLHTELQRQQQSIAGFPVLFRDDDGQDRLAAPFRRRKDGPELAPPAGWQLREFAAGRWLVVYPADGDLLARLAAGERMLRRAAQERGLRIRGPLTAQPHVHLQEGPPDAERLAAPVVRMALPVE